ncbi:hypothetical protein [Paenibacillus sp. ACRRY]|uniref:hypothetical protein n=1 Tax=Paenibacillus sp. ACRRY TaxID=2918208 RepID=UPI001EF49F53|nr:hypothetical protein [Paenibacillus sp. ACRRY]MCG7383376.1 hypothetical protein [Paenibacillus sp. ACRRY]
MTNFVIGSQAVVTHKGKAFSSYVGLAHKLGYPDAAVKYDDEDTRRRLVNGDIVKLLATGHHENGIYPEPIWVVETAHNERYLIIEEGLRSLGNITVLKDESLGGIEREYREVKRKARAGERIKIVAAEYDINGGTWGYDNGEIHTVISSDGMHEINIRPDGTEDSEMYVEQHEYVTLEQTDIIRINGERFRMVDRRAAVGDSVLITEGSEFYEKGSVIPFHKRAEYASDLVINYLDGEYGTVGAKFRVLEPVTSAEPAPLLSDKTAPDQAAELIAKLTTRVASLEKRVAALETPPIAPRFSGVGVRAQEAADAFAKAAQSINERTSVTVAEVTADLAQRAKEARQRRRDDIVKRAKQDLNELSNGYGNYIFREPRTRLGRICDVEFVVTRDKRKVTAILRGVNSRKVYAVGRAVCSPDDVFNVHLGRAISLRKALNQPIPPEYFEAPNPTEVRVGDVVRWTNAYRDDHTEVLTLTKIEGDQCWLSDGYFDDKCTLTVLDDSRESDSAEPRKEVA